MASVLLANSFFVPISFAKKTYKSQFTKLDERTQLIMNSTTINT